MVDVVPKVVEQRVKDLRLVVVAATMDGVATPMTTVGEAMAAGQILVRVGRVLSKMVRKTVKSRTIMVMSVCM